MSQVMGQQTVGIDVRPLALRTLRYAREIAIMGALFVGYRQIRFLTRNDTEQAMANAVRVLDAERAWFVSERSVQQLALRSETLIQFLNRYYVGVHFPLTITFVVWLLVRRPDWFPTMRNWLIGVTTSALAIHVAFPLAPPRMLAGFVDTLEVYGPDIYPADQTQSVANQFAAMPSLHFGWSVIVALGFVVVTRSRWRWMALAHPLVTLLAIVATGNHYWLDAGVAGILVAAVAAATVVPARRRERLVGSLAVDVPDLQVDAVHCERRTSPCSRQPVSLAAPLAWPSTVRGPGRDLVAGANANAARRAQSMADHPSSAIRREATDDRRA